MADKDNQKTHPVASEGRKDISLKNKKNKEFVDVISLQISGDINARQTHEKSLAKWYDRRYQRLDRSPDLPWRGSSNIVMPVIDIEIDKGKAPLMNVFNADPIVSFKPMNASAMDTSDSAEQTMEWLLNVRMRDFLKNAEIIADNMEMYGYSIGKVVYEYETQIVTEVIRRDELSEDDIEDIGQSLAGIQAGKITQEEFEFALGDLIADNFGLNVEDKVDQQAITEVMNFILDEKAGDEISIKKREVSTHAPFVEAINPALFIPERDAMGIQQAERLTEVKFFTENDLRMRGRDGYFNEDAVKRIIKGLKDRGDEVVDPVKKDNMSGSTSERLFSQLENRKADREGITKTDRDSVIEVREVYTLFDIDGDGVKEKVLLIYNPDFNEILRFMEFPYEHGQWPFIQFRNEEADGRYYSPRGIPEILDDIDDLVTQNHRAKLNMMTIVNSPTFKYRLGSNVNPNNFQWSPGSFVPVTQMDDFEPVAVPHNDVSYDNEENLLNLWVERRIGSIEQSLRSQKGEARTAQEISAVQGLEQSALSLKINRWQRSWKEVYHQIWALWLQYGPSQFIISQSEGQIKPLSRHQIQGKFSLQPVGTVGDVNPQLQFQRSQQRFQLLMQLQQAGMMQLFGDEFEVDFAAAFKDLMNKDDLLASSRIVRRRTPEEIAEIQKQRQAQAEQQQTQQQIQQNQPVSIGDLQSNVKQLAKDSPNGGEQQVTF